jgi:thiol:disulfide interchange protein DsbD
MLEQLNEWGYALSQTLQGQLETGSLLALLVVFAAGLLTSLTPCVYPMIPVTVTFIGGASGGNRKRAVTLSVVYVLGMAAVYAALGVAAALLGRTFGQFTRSPWVFGIALLDLISIPVPGMAVGVQQKGAKRGGLLGAALMGVAAGFVAAPCTAPVLGALLFYIGSTRDVVWGGTLMLVFALGLGMLLMLLGIFSGMLTSLPRAGVWMDWIKKIFGVGLVITGVWFCYQAVQLIMHPAGGL